MKRYLAWDIETIPTEHALSLPYPGRQNRPDPPRLTRTGKYRTEDDLKAEEKEDREEWEEERIKGYSFNPRLARIVALSLNYRGEEFIDMSAFNADDEKGMITEALVAMMDRTKNDLIVGYNNREFDWPFLMKRAMYHRIDLFDIQPNRHIWHDMHDKYSRYNVDASELVNVGRWNRTPGSLDDWASFCGHASKQTDGGMIYEMYRNGDVEGVKRHCRGDVLRTGVVFERFYQLWRGA